MVFVDKTVRVGGVVRPRDVVRDFAFEYLSGSGAWAYPAYDAYRGGGSGPVDDADLLSICLLNAGQRSIRTYYTLQKLMEPMNERLSLLPADGDLATATDEILSAVADLFGILDDYKPTPYVSKTKLLKVLHRKRPALIPLFDENIRRCYSELGDKPVPKDPSRSNRGFALAWLPAVQRDLLEQNEFWNEIASLALPGVPITPLRALDIVAWRIGGKDV